MKQENIDFLQKNRACYREVTNIVGGRSAQLAHRIADELLTILRIEFEPGYPAPSDCGDCLFTMVRVLYEKLDAYLATRPQPVIVQASFPKDEPPVQIDPEYLEYLNWKKQKKLESDVITALAMVETQDKAESKPIKRRAKRK
jgi:hypothetical protein